jgi:hypothetical protein
MKKDSRENSRGPISEANYSRDTIKIRDDSSSVENRKTSWMTSAVGPPEWTVGQSATVEKTAKLSRDTSNSSRNSQLKH